jgi:hypothetical protein
MIGVRSLYSQFWWRGNFRCDRIRNAFGALYYLRLALLLFLEILSGRPAGTPISHASLPRNRPTKASNLVSHEPLLLIICGNVLVQQLLLIFVSIFDSKISIFLLSIITCWTFDSSRFGSYAEWIQTILGPLWSCLCWNFNLDVMAVRLMGLKLIFDSLPTIRSVLFQAHLHICKQ